MVWDPLIIQAHYCTSLFSFVTLLG